MRRGATSIFYTSRYLKISPQGAFDAALSALEAALKIMGEQYLEGKI
jgi:hypothetical protein